MRLRLLEARLDTPQGNKADEAAPNTSEESQPPSDREAALRERIYHLDTLLNDEGYDPQWSSLTEDRLESAFSKAAFQGSSLQRIKCGSTFCGLTVRHQNVSAQSDFESFAPPIGRMGALMITHAASEGQLETVMYFVRKEFDTGKHPVRAKFR